MRHRKPNTLSSAAGDPVLLHRMAATAFSRNLS
jgi:hypothetical protein